MTEEDNNSFLEKSLKLKAENDLLQSEDVFEYLKKFVFICSTKDQDTADAEQCESFNSFNLNCIKMTHRYF